MINGSNEIGGKLFSNGNELSTHDVYQRNLGEAEARLTQKRLDYTPEQRQAIFPYDDLDVPRGELWIGDKGKGVRGALSINPYLHKSW